MRVSYLFAIEGVGGRGDALRSPVDLFFDRQANELYIADAGLGSVFVFNREGTFLQEIEVRQAEGSPTLVATDAEGRIYVGHNRSAKISVYDFRGELLEALELPGTVDMPGSKVRPFLLTRAPSGRVVAMKTRGGLVEIDPYGEDYREVPLALADGPAVVKGFASDNLGNYFFTDMRPASVVRWNSQDDSTLRFGKPGVIYGQLTRPQGVAIDDAGHVFVTSLIRNNVLCYDKGGNFVEEFGGIGRDYGRFYMPSKIVSDGVDRLYVLERPLRRIQVFEVSFPDPLQRQVRATDKAEDGDPEVVLRGRAKR
jgi:DNA-binding beta-propeller fold protein YncE